MKIEAVLANILKRNSLVFSGVILPLKGNSGEMLRMLLYI